MLVTRRKLPLNRREIRLTKEVNTFRSYIDSKPHYFAFKRSFDLLFSLLIIVFVLSWLIPLMALIIKLDSKGPVFFIQSRTGKGGRPFFCFKFRTMKVNIEANHQQAVENDSRITRIGSFLRNSCIDELPQFINVLLGHMSIVGPRPHMIADCHRFSRVVGTYKFRNMVRPGITGLAQIKGYRGPVNEYRSILRRYQYDAFYIRQANFWLDMRIIRKTVAQMAMLIFVKVVKPGKSKQEKTGDAYAKIAA